MSLNDLLDLDLSAPSTVVNNASGSTTPSGSNGAARAYGRSTFDYLASATSSAGPYYSSTARNGSPSPSLPAPTSRSGSPFVPGQPPLVGANSTGNNSYGRASPSFPSNGAPLQSKSVSPNGAPGDDAFSSLFGASPSASASTSAANALSMAERLARESSVRIGGAGGAGVGASGGGNWNALTPGVRAGNSRSGSPALQAPPSRTPSLNVSSPSSSTAAPDPWDFDLLSTSSNSAKPSVSHRPSSPSNTTAGSAASLDPFDAFAFDAPVAASLPSRPAVPTSSRPPAARKTSFSALDDSDDDFDRSRQEGLLGSSGTSDAAGYASDDAFDILGDLSKPISASVPRPPQAPAPSGPSPIPRAQGPPSRAASPPPHILGQLVEMGFSIPQARTALAATTSGSGDWNVEAALEVLFEQSAAEEQIRDRRSSPPPESRRRPTEQQERSRRPQNEDPVLQARPPQATGRRAREAAARARETEESVTPKVQEQAQELLQQASKIGFSMFKSATGYWESGRAIAQKALDDAMASESAGGEGGGRRREGKGQAEGSRVPPTKGRPKWMTEQFVEDEYDQAAQEIQQSSASSSRPPSRAPPQHQQQRQPTPPLFQDSDTEDPVLPQRPTPTSRPALSQQQQPPQPTPSAEYRSPWRRAKSTPSPAPPAQADVPSRSATPRSAASASGLPAQPKPARPPRLVVPVSSHQLATSTEHKAKGNDLFKLGRFGDAEALYGKAIDVLPLGSLALIPLYNNRANARLRNGDEKNAAEDCTQVVAIILGPAGVVGGRVDINALEEESASLPAEAQDVNLKDHLAKALARRAKANEANEKFQLALEDYNLLYGGGEAFMKAAGGSKLVSEGMARCRKVVNGGAGSSSNGTSSSAPRPPPVASKARPAAARPSAPPVQGSGEAVKALREANEAAANEDDLRLSLKDGVDARIMAWKGGKEANLRALIASLDSVLWPELEWKKVGMHELISEGQLKVRYVRAIAKVHPDKLNVSNTTVEQRMIAGAVFAGLNDAWNASK